MKKRYFFYITIIIFYQSFLYAAKEKDYKTEYPFIISRKHYKIFPNTNLILKQFVFDNKLSLYFIENKNAPVFHYRTYYHIGSVHEPEGVKGIAHLFEHMMFVKFTKKDPEGKILEQLNRGDLWTIYQEIGGEHLNASTWTDRTDYYLSAPREKLEDVVKIEALRMKYLDISTELLETEKNAVFTEFSRAMDNPSWAIYSYFDDFAYEKHPYKFDTIGTVPDLINISLSNCLDFYNKYYSPQNASIFVVGNINEDTLISLIHKYYGDFKNESKLEYPTIPIEPLQIKEKIKTIYHHVPNEKIMFGYRIPGHTEKYNHEFNKANKIAKDNAFSASDIASLTILGELMAQGDSSDFENQLVNNNKASGYEYFIPPLQYPTFMYFSIDLAKDIKGEDIFSTIDEIITKYKTKLVDSNDLKRIKNRILLKLYNSLESVYLMTTLITSDFIAADKDPLAAFKFIDAIKKVKAQDIKRTAHKYFDSSRRAIIYMKNGEPAHKGMFDKITGRGK